MTGKVTLERLEARQKELQTIYRELHFQRRAVFLGDSEASLSRQSPVDFERVAQVEALVLLIQRDQRRAFTVTPRFKTPPQIDASPVGEILLKLDEICQFVEDPRHRLSPRVRMFLRVLELWRFNTPLLRNYQGIVKAQDLSLRDVEGLNSLVEEVRRALVSSEFRKELNKEQAIADRRYQEALQYVKALRRSVGDIVVIPLEINTDYKHRNTHIISESESCTPAIVEWFNAFRAEARHQPAMKEVIGFLGCWECSEVQGIYARVLFILDAARVPDGKLAADAIGRCWIEHTDERGSYTPSYLTAADHDKLLTVVQVERRNHRTQRQLQEVALRYFTQHELVFRDKQLGFDRFFRGEIRRVKKAKGDGGESSVTEETKAAAVAVDLVEGDLPTSRMVADAAGNRFTFESDGILRFHDQ